MIAVALLLGACASRSNGPPRTGSPPPQPAPTATKTITTTTTTAPTTTTTAPTTTTHPTAGPCGTLPVADTHYRHVVWVWMENHSAGSVIGSPAAPYENALASQCGLATNYHNVTHPSLPNYVAATSGLPLDALSPFTADCDPSPRCEASGPSLFQQAPSWKAYEESMPSDCDHGSAGEYAARHNPAVYYPAIAAQCAVDDVAYPELAADLAHATLPAFSFVTPNLTDDSHDGSVADGDRWLAANLPLIFDSTAYRAGTVAVFVTWDEGEGGSASDCAANTTDVGCRVAAIVASPSTPPGAKPDQLFNHYSLLRTTEQLLGLPLLGEAATAPSMAAAFSLSRS